MTITEISPKDGSPIKKQDLTITGTNFGTDKSAISVTLISTAKTYDLSVWKVTDTEIIAVLPGGDLGEYDVKVKSTANGETEVSDKTKFTYSLTITKVDVKTGSIFGGNTLTITGTNFSIIKSENVVNVAVFVNNKLPCNVVSCTTTEIVCTTSGQLMENRQGIYLDNKALVTLT